MPKEIIKEGVENATYVTYLIELTVFLATTLYGILAYRLFNSATKVDIKGIKDDISLLFQKFDDMKDKKIQQLEAELSRERLRRKDDTSG